MAGLISDLPNLLIYAIALLLIVLGFVALLSQKTYLDAESQKVTEVELPLIGKMKTNVPSLVFVFLGVFVAVYAYERAPIEETKKWSIKGKFGIPKNLRPAIPINWEGINVELHPSSISVLPKARGDFELVINIKEKSDFEKEFEGVSFEIFWDNTYYNCHFFPKDEYEKFKNKPNTSIYKDVRSTQRFLGKILLKPTFSGDGNKCEIER